MKKGFFLLLSKGSLITALSFYMLHAYAVGIGSTNPNTGSSSLRAPDSRLVVPPVSTTVKPQYPSIDIPSTPLPNDMSTLPTCPANPVCADINGKMPAGYTVPTTQSCDMNWTTWRWECVNQPSTVSSCPATCTVSRTVNETTLANGVVKITSSVAAACPPGYSAIAVYNVGKEIGYQTYPPAAPFPIPDAATYQAYISNNYRCDLIAQTDPVGSCGQQVTTRIAGVNQVITSFGMTDSGQLGLRQGVGQWTTNSNNGCFLKGISNCSIPSPCGDAYNMLYTYYFSYYLCYPPAGLYYTDNMTPTSIVCTVARPAWHTAQ